MKRLGYEVTEVPCDENGVVQASDQNGKVVNVIVIDDDEINNFVLKH